MVSKRDVHEQLVQELPEEILSPELWLWLKSRRIRRQVCLLDKRCIRLIYSILNHVMFMSLPSSKFKQHAAKTKCTFGSFLNLFLQVIKHCHLTRVGVSKSTSVIFKQNYRGTINQYQTIIEHYCADVFLFFFSTQNARRLTTRNWMTSAKQHQNQDPKRIPTNDNWKLKSIKLWKILIINNKLDIKI